MMVRISLVLVLALVTACNKEAAPPSPGGSGSASAAQVTPPREADPPPPAGPAVATTETVTDAGAAAVGPAAPPDADVAEVERRKRMEKEEIETAAALAMMLSSDDDGGVHQGDMSKRRPGADLGAQIDAVKASGRNVRVSGSRGDGMTGTATGSGRPAPSSPSGRISVDSKQTFDDSTLTPDIVLRKIQAAYMAGLKRCYKERLKVDPALRGKLKLELTVNEAGRTVNGKSRGFDATLDACITGLMGSWRFPIPKDKDDEATEASFSIAISLIPD